MLSEGPTDNISMLPVGLEPTGMVLHTVVEIIFMLSIENDQLGQSAFGMAACEPIGSLHASVVPF